MCDSRAYPKMLLEAYAVQKQSTREILFIKISGYRAYSLNATHNPHMLRRASVHRKLTKNTEQNNHNYRKMTPTFNEWKMSISFFMLLVFSFLFSSVFFLSFSIWNGVNGVVQVPSNSLDSDGFFVCGMITYIKQVLVATQIGYS